MLVWMGKMMSKRIKYTDAVPNSIVTRYKEDNTQYLLDQVARLTAENAMLKEKWLAQPLTREEISQGFRTNDADLDAESYWAGVKLAEKMHGIGGEPLSNEQKRLEAIAIKQREAHGFGGE